MPDLKWSGIANQQFGRCGEYYAQIEFLSYGFEIYTSDVDDHGVDFVAKYNDRFYEVQVKAVRQDNYLYIPKRKITVSDNFLICYLRFTDGMLPDVYVFPTSVWKTPNALFVDRPYDKPGQTSEPEFGISYNKKNASLLEAYRAVNYFNLLKINENEQTEGGVTE